MIDEKYEYLFILLTLGLTGLALVYDHLRSLVKKREFWLSMCIFCGYCLIIEAIAITLGWWQFNQAKVMGLWIGKVPVEELLLFPLIFSIIISVFESQAND